MVYNENDILVRKYVAGMGITNMAGKLAGKLRGGSGTVRESKLLEVAIAQFEVLKGYQAIENKAHGIFKPLANTGADVLVKLMINGILVTDEFYFTNDNAVTSQNIVEAMEVFTSIPEYTAVVVGDEVHIQPVEVGASYNGHTITLEVTPVGVTYESTRLVDGQDGVIPEDNIISEEKLEFLFNNISKITGVGYAPLGTKYKPA